MHSTGPSPHVRVKSTTPPPDGTKSPSHATRLNTPSANHISPLRGKEAHSAECKVGKIQNGLLHLRKGWVQLRSVKELWSVFAEMDGNGDGKVDMNELEHHLLGAFCMPKHQHHLHPHRPHGDQEQLDDFYEQQQNLHRTDMHASIKKFSEKPLTFKEVLHILYPKATREDLDFMYRAVCPVEIEKQKEKEIQEVVVSTMEVQNTEDMQAYFDLYDIKREGKITAEDLSKIVNSLGLTERESSECLEDINPNSEEYISKADFVDWCVHGTCTNFYKG